jgi:hypothetical protein
MLRQIYAVCSATAAAQAAARRYPHVRPGKEPHKGTHSVLSCVIQSCPVRCAAGIPKALLSTTRTLAAHQRSGAAGVIIAARPQEFTEYLTLGA